MEDSTIFTKMVEEQSSKKQLGPIEGIRQNGRKIFIAFGVICLNAVSFYIIFVQHDSVVIYRSNIYCGMDSLLQVQELEAKTIHVILYVRKTTMQF